MNETKCWLYVTKGLCLNAQDELLFLLKCSLDQDNNLTETQVPRQILYHIMDIYDKSIKGFRVSYMNHLLYDFESEKIAIDILNTNLNPKSCSSSKQNSTQTNLLFENKDNSGFVYFRPTCYHDAILKKLSAHLPDKPYLIGYLIQKWELPWAKLFPLRLLLRLGEQFECEHKFQLIN